MKRGKQKAPPPGYCTVCQQRWPVEEMATCCPTLCHRHCPHPLPPTEIVVRLGIHQEMGASKGRVRLPMV